MDEFQFIDSIKQNAYRQAGLIKGIGDDAAVFMNESANTVIAVDTFVEDIHFNKKTMTPFHIGYKALAANVSDMAAMGATPTFYLVSIVIPKTYPDADLQAIYQGMDQLARRFNMDLIGGDTVSGKQLVISVTVLGKVLADQVRYRHTAMEGDVVFVTGNLGGAAAGLFVLQNGLNHDKYMSLIKKHQMPEPRVTFAENLQPLSRVTLNDVSDGIANELHEIAANSQVKIVIDDKKVPLNKACEAFEVSLQEQWKYFAGEDFELIGTVPQNDWPLLEKIAFLEGLSVTEIGYVAYNKDGNWPVYLKKEGQLQKLRQAGYIHKR